MRINMSISRLKVGGGLSSQTVVGKVVTDFSLRLKQRGIPPQAKAWRRAGNFAKTAVSTSKVAE